ncbi:UNVERIFIED_CONTAM: hypothetical protein GTU68_050947 [Idotea baltica]|nr:hypothetical protein [Idotea baltica]
MSSARAAATSRESVLGPRPRST